MKIITLTLNPAFDMHCHTENFMPYHENLADVSSLDAGGKGVNISRALSSFGIENKALVILGDENGDTFRRALDSDGIDCISIETKGRIRENITLHTNGAPETRISFRGFEADGALLDKVGAVLLEITDTDTVITFTGSLPKGISVSDCRELLCALKQKGAKIVIDSRSFTLDDIAAVRPWLIKPNEEEIAMYSSLSITDLESAAKAALELRASSADNVMISLGGAGAVLACADGAFAASAPEIDVLSTIGAGDSSIAGFIAAAKAGGTYADMLKNAVCFGSAACMSEGTRPPRKKDVAALLRQVTVQKIS